MGLREHLQSIYDQHGKLTPELVVEAARPKSHPLHDRVFDRPKGEAAEAWYRHRAHDLIRSVKVVYAEGEDGPKDVRAFQAVRSEGPETYVFEPTEKVVRDEFTTRLLIREVERERAQLDRKLSELHAYIRWARGEEAEAS